MVSTRSMWRKREAERLGSSQREGWTKEEWLAFALQGSSMDECLVCSSFIHSDEVHCLVSGCRKYHLNCAKEQLGFTGSGNFKCPQHACVLCRRKRFWRCIRCPVAAHSDCVPGKVHIFPDQQELAFCWKHPLDWRRERELHVPSNHVQETVGNLPVPYSEDDFSNYSGPAPTADDYKKIRSNHFEPNLAERIRTHASVECYCTDVECGESCECRITNYSCSRKCICTMRTCKNRPFRKMKKLKLVETGNCGKGVVAAEALEEGDFVIEYVGEVIDDEEKERRLADLRNNEELNYYMAELGNGLTIDARQMGNISRFFNHSCDPNCKAEKWGFNGETRLGIIALRDIRIGEPLTWDYRWEVVGPSERCYCGAAQCKGYLGARINRTSEPATSRASTSHAPRGRASRAHTSHASRASTPSASRASTPRASRSRASTSRAATHSPERDDVSDNS